nr:Asp23/Gls24 family envelope stress response protein [Eubacterium sp.]
MKGQLDNDMGTVLVDEDVLAKYAGSAAVECFGVVGMASVSMKDGIVSLLKKENIRHGVSVRVEENKLYIDMHIIVAYGVSIMTVAQNLVENVKYKVEEFTGMEVGKIIVCVEGVKVVD